MIAQVIGLPIPLSTVCRLTGEEKIDLEDSDHDDTVYELQASYNGQIIDTENGVSLYKMTHDLFPDKDFEMLVGIPVLVYSNSRNDDETYEKFVTDLETIQDTFVKFQEWMKENDIKGKVKMYTVTSDCSCCS